MTAIWETLVRGGVVMIPLFLASVIALAVVIERAFFLRRKRILPPDLIQVMNNIESPDELEKVMTGFKKYQGPFLNILKTALENRGRSRDEVKEIVTDRGRQEARTLERGLVILETIAGIAPLLGLLGTVLGMIKVFRVISEQGLGQTQSLSGGISEALLTTVIGLSIAIPTLVAYNYFSHKVEDLMVETEKISAHLLEKLQKHPSPGKTKT
jgi:biopolymer transport protein ExbB